MSGAADGARVPKLRFPEFEAAWEKKQLGEFFTFKNGVNADKSMYGRGHKFINVMDVISGAPIRHESIIGRVEISDREFEKNEVVYGDVLFQRSSETREEVGQSNIYLDTRSATFGGFVIRGRPKSKIDPRFFDNLLKTQAVRKDMTSRSGGSTRYNIGQESLEAVTAYVAPTFNEQEKVATFVGGIDIRQTLLTQRQGALTAYKKAMMQRIFAQDLRFAHADGSPFPGWQEKRLGSLGGFRGGGTPETAISDYWLGEIPWVSSADISDSNVRSISISRHVSREAIASSATCVVPARSILIVSRVGVGKLAVTEKEVCTSQDFCNFTPLRDNPYFIAYWMVHNQKALLRLCQGTSIKGLTTVDLKGLSLPIPHPDEQQKIADFLSAVDAKIDAVAAQIATMQRVKIALLQKMFI